MMKVINCPCGYVIEAADDEHLIAAAQTHAKEAHGMELSREQALAMAQPL